jgi:hypothetical protein
MDDADLTTRIQEIYKDMIADTDAHLDRNTEEIKQLKKKLEEKDVFWQKKIEEVEKKWSNKYTAIQNKYNTIKRENDNLKKRIKELESHK